MTAPTLYEIETSEGDDGTMHPAEQAWTPCADGAADHGFIAHQGLFVAGIDGGADDDLYPVGFLVLGHQRWADIIEAAATYMARIHGWHNLHLYPGEDPAVLIPRIPRAVHTHGVFLRHPPRTTAADATGRPCGPQRRPCHRDAAPGRARDRHQLPRPRSWCACGLGDLNSRTPKPCPRLCAGGRAFFVFTWLRQHSDGI
ncbi:hypothetical protein AB0I82_35445 [Streptomyces sp. NPDC050315]|uniref:hypothetical protein n=1 Tax=Streptomyces sp. NPDC050315 TaxID=3155039 RepID=UPI003429DE15